MLRAVMWWLCPGVAAEISIRFLSVQSDHPETCLYIRGFRATRTLSSMSRVDELGSLDYSVAIRYCPTLSTGVHAAAPSYVFVSLAANDILSDQWPPLLMPWHMRSLTVARRGDRGRGELATHTNPL